MPTNTPVLAKINEKYDELTKMQQKIADFIRKNSSQVIRMSISDLAEATGNKSESSIVRFYRILGFSGYHDFKVALATEIAGKSFYHAYSELTENDNVSTVKEKIYNGIIKTLHDNYSLIDDDSLEKAVDLIFKAKRIIFLGFGQSGYMCENAKFKFTRLGFNCFYSPDSHFNTMLLTEPKDGDLLICISFSGLTKDVIVPAQESKPVAKVIAITGSAKSTLGQLADVCLVSHTEELNYRTDAMMARHVQNMFLDMIYIAVTIQMGDSVVNRLNKTKQALSYLKF